MWLTYLQLLLDGAAGLEQLRELVRAEDVAQRGLSQEFGGTVDVDNILHRHHRIHDAEVDNSINSNRHTVFGENLQTQEFQVGNYYY